MKVPLRPEEMEIAKKGKAEDVLGLSDLLPY